MAAAAKTATKAPLTLSQLAAKIRHKGAGEMAYFSGLTHEEAGQLLAIAERLQAENTRMREMLKWEQQVFRVPNVKPADKLVLIATRREVEYQRQKQGREETDTAPVDVYRASVAERVGLSADTTGDSWKSLNQLGAIEKRQHYVTKASGEKVPQLSIALTDTALSDPHALAPAEPRMQGGRPDRKHCKECGSERLKVYVQVVCADCGAIVEARERLVNPPEEIPGTLSEVVAGTVEECAGPDIASERQVDVQPLAQLAGLVPVVTPAKGSPKYCPNTIDNRHRYGNFRTADYRRICQYCATPEEKPYLTTVQARRIAAKVP